MEDVYRCRDHAQLAELSATVEKQNLERARLSSQIDELQAQLKELRTQSDPALLEEYESLLNETMAETDALKSGIAALSERLYTSMGAGFKPDESEQSALLKELSQAIYSAIACAAGKNSPTTYRLHDLHTAK